MTFLDRLENLYLLNSIFEQGILLLDRDRDRRELFEVMAHHRFFDFQYQRKLYLGAGMSLDAIAAKIARIAGFRNFLAHDYEKINYEDICQVMLQKLDEVKKYIAYLESSL